MIMNVSSPQSDLSTCTVHSYREMYCFFVASASAFGRSVSSFNDAALKNLCNAMARIDYSIDNCHDKAVRQRAQADIVAFLICAGSLEAQARIEIQWFYQDLLALRESLTPHARRRVAELSRSIFRLCEIDRRTTREHVLVQSKKKQGELAALMAVSAMGIGEETFSQTLVHCGSVANLLDAFVDCRKDFKNQETLCPPSISLQIQYGWAFCKELTLATVQVVHKPWVPLQVLIKSAIHYLR